MKQIINLIVIFAMIAVSFAGYQHHSEYKAIQAKVCDTNAKITENQWSALKACGCGCNETDSTKADFTAGLLANCSSAANEASLQALKLSGNAEQNKLVNEMCSDNYQKCKKDYMRSYMKDQKKGDHKSNGDGDQANKREQHKQKIAEQIKCMKSAVGIAA